MRNLSRAFRIARELTRLRVMHDHPGRELDSIYVRRQHSMGSDPFDVRCEPFFKAAPFEIAFYTYGDEYVYDLAFLSGSTTFRRWLSTKLKDPACPSWLTRMVDELDLDILF